MITGEFTFFAASITAFIEFVPITFTAGKAKAFAFATSNIFCKSSPNTTPGLTKSKIFAFCMKRPFYFIVILAPFLSSFAMPVTFFLNFSIFKAFSI